MLTPPPAHLRGVLAGPRAELVADDGPRIDVDLEAGTVDPESAAMVLPGAAPQQEAAALLADALRRSPLIGPARVTAVEAVIFDLGDWLRRQSHQLFPSEADETPVTPSVDLAPAALAGWPPPALVMRARSGVPDEGQWTLPPGAPDAEGRDPPVRRTFVRVDPDRPYERVYLFAFDTQRLGLHFVAGTRHPSSTTGARGRGSIPNEDRDHLVAAFNGGFKLEHGAYGAVERSRVLVPPSTGLATVVTDADGRAAFGVWDTGPVLPAPWIGLRQNLPPLLRGGVVNPTRTRNWGQNVASLDAAQTPRSALGVSTGGILVYAWASAASAEQIAEAMRRAGVEFALHLDMNPGHTGLELYTPEGEGEVAATRGVEEMDYRARRWLRADARDFFYLTRRTSTAARFPLPPGQPAAGEARWTPVEGLGAPSGLPAAVWTAWLDGRSIDSEFQVRLLRVDPGVLRPHVVPGLAEAPPAAGVIPHGEVRLKRVPALWLDIGVGSEAGGLVAAGYTWRPPRVGAMTFAVDDAGGSHIGRFGAGDLRRVRFSELRQGPALLEGGRPAEGASGISDLPEVAVGRDAEGDLVFAFGEDGDRAALARSLVSAGVTDALVLCDASTADTGATRFFLWRGGRLLMFPQPGSPMSPANLEPGAGSALVFAPRPLGPRAFVASTFSDAAGLPID